jgi:hypothetical protein
MKRFFLFAVLALTLTVFIGCGEKQATSPEVASSLEGGSLAKTSDYSGHTVVLGYAETITDPASGEEGRVIWFQNDLGNGQLGHDFVYNDPRRASFNGGEAGITYGVKTGFESSDDNLTDQIGWLHESIDVWDRENCADMILSENPVNANSPGLVENFFNGGGIDLGLVEADLTQIGFLGQGVIFPPGTSTLGVTYTLFWADADGNLTDIDGNGKIDVALREIYYNDQYDWADNGLEGTQPDGTRLFDFPTVAIHEVGHGFSSAHFGNIGVKDGFLFAKPRTVMNAIYGGIQRDLTGRDVGGHCSNWSQWPNK